MASIVFESTLAAPGRTFGDHYSRPYFFFEAVPDVSHYSLFDQDQYDHGLWEGAQEFITKIIQEDECRELVTTRLDDKNMSCDGTENLISKCKEFRQALFAEDLKREIQTSEMKRLFADSEYLGKQLTRDVENYEQLAYLIDQVKQVTDNMAQNKPSILKRDEKIDNIWEEIFWALLVTDAHAMSVNKEDMYDNPEDPVKCSNFTHVQRLLAKVRIDKNEMESLKAQIDAESLRKVKEGEDPHSPRYNEAIYDDYQLQIQYHKFVDFPQTLQELLDQYYDEVRQMDEIYHQITPENREVQAKASDLMNVHIGVIKRLLPSVILPPFVLDQSLLDDTKEDEIFDKIFGAEFEVGLANEFDWGRMRYCKDDDIFAHLGVENPKELADILQVIPNNFNGYANSKLVTSDIVSRAGIRAQRRAPSLGTFNPQTYCHSQLDTIKGDQEETEEQSFWDQIGDFFKRVFGNTQEEKIEAFDAFLDEEGKEQARLRRSLQRADLNCMTYWHKKLYEFDQFYFEMTYHERFTHALKPIIEDSNAILNNLKYICTLHNVDKGCPL